MIEVLLVSAYTLLCMALPGWAFLCIIDTREQVCKLRNEVRNLRYFVGELDEDDANGE